MNKITSKKILVTGADGFIGSHLAETLVKTGHDVKALVQYNSFGNNGWLEHTDIDILTHMDIVSGDIRDAYGIKDVMQDCDVVFNLAALIAIPYSYHNPASYVETNINGTLNIVQAAKELGVSRVIHTSTSEVYGSAQFVPITEQHPLVGQSPYAASKIGADQLAMSFFYSFDLPVSIIRPFNTYGPRQSARAIIPTVITQIASGAKSIKLGALSPTRDFNYVQDTVNGFIAMANSKDAIGKTINLGSNFEISIKDLVNLICETMGADIDIELDSKRMRPENSEVDRLWADNTLAKELLDWSPSYSGRSGLRRGLENTIAWLQSENHASLFKALKYNI